jgi:hypothetical protein
MPNIHCPSKAFRVGTYRGWPHFRRRFYPHNYAMSQEYVYLGARLIAAVANVPDVPASITVPFSSIDGSYTVSWGTAAGVGNYELYEATDSGFSDPTMVYSGTDLSSVFANKPSGTYYYRVRACNDVGCGGYRTGTSGIVVSAPSAPASITVPSSSINGAFSVSWGASTGSITRYELFEALNSSFSGEVLVFAGMALSNSFTDIPNGTYYYRVRACNQAFCSGYTTAANSVVINIPAPSQPTGLTVPATNSTGSYSVSWGAASGTVTKYELYEAAASDFVASKLIYSGTALTASVVDNPSGTYYYRLRACYYGSCSAYSVAPNATVVTIVPPSAPASVTVPASSVNGAYVIAWTAASGTIARYELYEATDSAFTTSKLAYSGANLSLSVSSKANGTYYYRVRACNNLVCGDYAAGTNGIVVAVPPPAVPPSIIL